MNDTMRVVTQDALGDADVLRLDRAERPQPELTEILVRVKAAGLNPVDWKVRRTGTFLGEPPFRVGWDVSGVVEAVGAGVRTLAPGDEVLGMPRFPAPVGAYADYVTGPSRHFVRKPAALSHAEAAGLPLAGLTAWQALVDVADVQPGQRVLVHAAAGGVGHLAVQIAAAKGAHVIGTASAAKHPLLRELGAAEVIDYRTTDFTTVLSDVDVVLDAIGGDYGPRSLTVLRKGGILVSILSPEENALIEPAAEYGVNAGFVMVEPDQIGLLGLVDLIEAGKLRIHVDRAFDLDDVVAAHELLESGHVTGKVVLTVA
ncbi:NADP-dependent oxidoreductase [Stackebrandtia nassauensis]|uniref:Alcohol dehydrogenase zinc-binding domain protein n=1 Tax=Stackebrandtia nassauensis (strain DSM 44728 / CIP 108903 / NRRL B-16338 / NBRC 102104 / LLR-40K-21) TaxID=446470 RepID=D3Q4X5_STANL|nr:NADP-dependent oxidoreductase [Stackebrandtia nassauensis]ADD42155.1 Alcohol dehydrogenase zinc-binding domain protein [Stackebrandtia nassauensis DSM 44728]